MIFYYLTSVFAEIVKQVFIEFTLPGTITTSEVNTKTCKPAHTNTQLFPDDLLYDPLQGSQFLFQPGVSW